ncbi:MAG: amidohydrolase family protein [Planctomyces sp.]|nr:amidohydrolase family protein [Planctomyces sp.]
MSNMQCIRLASRLLIAVSLTASGLFGSTAVNADEQVHAFYVGKLWPGNAEPVTDAVMLVVDGKIRAVGARSTIEVPESAVRHELQDAVVVPGFVIAETSIGIASDDERTLTPEVRAIDGFDLFGDYSRYVAAGVTTVQISPGQARLMPGQGAVVKLAGDDHSRRILRPQESLRLVLSSESASAPRIYEPPVGAVSVDNPLDPTQPQIAQSLSARVAGLRAVFAAARTGESDNSGAFDFDAFRQNVSLGRIRIKARTSAEIRASLMLFAELQKSVDTKLQLILTDSAELDAFLSDAERLKSIGFVLNADVRPGQVLNPALPDEDEQPKKQAWDNAASLFEAGAGESVAVRPASDSDLNDVLFLAGLFTRGGTSQLNVLKMLTANPARILGVDATVGTLTADHDADFVVLSGDPFASGTLVESTWINGERVYHREAAKRATLVQADTIYTTNGSTVSDGGVLVAGSKIQAVGSSVSIPEDVSIRRFPGAVIVPGFVDLGTGLGFGGSVSRVSLGTTLGDRLASDDRTIAFARQGGVTTAVFAGSDSPSPLLAFKLGDTPRLLKEPVAIRFSMPSNLTSGVSGLQRTLASAKAYADAWTKYDAEMVTYQNQLKDYEVALAKYEAEKKAAAEKKAEEEKKAAEEQKAEEAKKAAGNSSGPKDESKPVGEVKTPAPTPAPTEKPVEKPPEKPPETPAEKPAEKPADKPADTKTDGSTLATTGQSEAGKPEAGKPEAEVDPNAPVKPTEPKKPQVVAASEPYRALMAGSIPAVVEARNVNAITAAVKLFREEFRLKMILVGADDAYRVADLLAKHEVSVSVGPTLVSRVENSVVNMPQVMANHQVAFAFQSNATTGVQQLPMAVQYAVFRGLGPADALNGLTESAATLLSLQSSIGSLEPGKDADLVVMSGPPFEPSSEVLAVMIDGEWVYERGAKP